jgi:hypothetical protein
MRKIISGMQTGADRAGVREAFRFGLETGGWMPRGYKALDRSHPEFAAMYGIKETSSPQYPGRTRRNVRDSDGTVAFAFNFLSRGEKLTRRCTEELDKPYMALDLNRIGGGFTTMDFGTMLREWLRVQKIKTLNVAGNTDRRTYDLTREIIAFTLEMMGFEARFPYSYEGHVSPTTEKEACARDKGLPAAVADGGGVVKAIRSIKARLCERCRSKDCACYRIGGRSQYLCQKCARDAQTEEQQK